MSKSLVPTSPGIYAIINLLDGKRYIGSAANIRRRWAEHRSHLSRGTHSSPKLQNAWNKHGEENFEFKIVEYVENKLELLSREQVWLDNAQPAYNYQKVAGRGNAGMKRGPLSEEHKAKLSAAKKGKPLPPEQREKLAALNKNKTPEWCRKISESKKGTVLSQEAKDNMRKAQLGRKHSQETIEKIRLAHTGKAKTEAHKKALSEARLKLYANLRQVKVSQAPS
jgi:group I intron endonuclease